jgi:hypothetical protein
MRHGSRKTAPKVRDGKVQRKNRLAPTPSYWNTPQDRPTIDRQRPGEGGRHVLMKRDVEQFIELLPDWADLAQGLRAIILAPRRDGCMGWHTPGVVAVCAWDRELQQDWTMAFVDEHAEVLRQLCVEQEPSESGTLCKFTESQARGFQLLHILLHELGHHHDRMTTRSQRRSSRGETFAEEYANRYAATIYSRYFDTFGW